VPKAYLTEKHPYIASCSSRSDTKSPAQQLVCQRHRARCHWWISWIASLMNICLLN